VQENDGYIVKGEFGVAAARELIKDLFINSPDADPGLDRNIIMDIARPVLRAHIARGGKVPSRCKNMPNDVADDKYIWSSTSRQKLIHGSGEWYQQIRSIVRKATNELQSQGLAQAQDRYGQRSGMWRLGKGLGNKRKASPPSNKRTRRR